MNERQLRHRKWFAAALSGLMMGFLFGMGSSVGGYQLMFSLGMITGLFFGLLAVLIDKLWRGV